MASYLAAGGALPLELAGLFVVGGVGGHGAGHAAGPSPRRPACRRSLPSAMVAVAAFVVAKTLN